MDGFLATGTGGGGGGGELGGLGKVTFSFVTLTPSGRAPPRPPFSGSGVSPGVSALSSTFASYIFCDDCESKMNKLFFQ